MSKSYKISSRHYRLQVELMILKESNSGDTDYKIAHIISKATYPHKIISGKAYQILIMHA